MGDGERRLVVIVVIKDQVLGRDGSLLITDFSSHRWAVDIINNICYGIRERS